MKMGGACMPIVERLSTVANIADLSGVEVLVRPFIGACFEGTPLSRGSVKLQASSDTASDIPPHEVVQQIVDERGGSALDGVWRQQHDDVPFVREGILAALRLENRIGLVELHFSRFCPVSPLAYPKTVSETAMKKYECPQWQFTSGQSVSDRASGSWSMGRVR
jgi:hypothetical protein